MHNILTAVILCSTWSFSISTLANRIYKVKQTLTKFTITLTFIQAPILLLLTLRTNRALDRLLESRKAWGMLNKATRTFMGLVVGYIMPRNPQAACIIARYLCISGWALKGMLRNESDEDMIRMMMDSVPEELNWVMAQNRDVCGSTRPHVIIYRLRNMISTFRDTYNNGNSNSGREVGPNIHIPPMILLRMEEILYDMESTIGICNRISTSPIPPTYTRHTSRVLVMYLSLLPVALVGMGVSTLAVVVTVACVSYILIGIDEIGLEIEHPFPLMPLYQLSKGIQKQIERYDFILFDMM